MLKNYFVTAMRHLLKNKWYTALNIFGLSVGLACFTLIGLWIIDEVGYDKFHSKADRIYRVAATFTDESGQSDQAVTCAPLAPALLNDLPEVEDAVRILRRHSIFQLGDNQFAEEHLAVDPSFFNLFDFKLLKGNPATALSEPYNIVLSESMAKKYFGDRDPLGQSIKIFAFDPGQRGADYKITGVIEDCPSNSHLQYKFLMSFKTVEAYSPDVLSHDGWFESRYYTYILAKSGASIDRLKSNMAGLLQKYIGPDVKKNKVYWSYFLQPITDIHLRSHLRSEIAANGSMIFVVIFGSIGLIVLLLACINYVNLSTAYSSDRFRDVGVRKVMGAHKRQLVWQYMVESWSLALMSVLVAFVWMELSRPLFETLTGKSARNLYSFTTILSLVTVSSLVGLLSGLYPSVILSSVRTVNVLKGQFKSGSSGAWLRKSLLVFQYSITIILVASIIIIQFQLNFIRNKDLGFNQENLLILAVNGSPEVPANYDGFLNDLSADPSVLGLARSNSTLKGESLEATLADTTGKQVTSSILINGVDPEYIDTYGMTLVAGRDFRKGSRADSLALIVNEATTRNYGYRNPEDAIGTQVTFNDVKYELIGVVKDYNYLTLHHKIEPVGMRLWRGGFSRIAVRLSGNVAHGVDVVTTAWKKDFPNSLLDYTFADEQILSQYQSEQRFSKIFLIFSVISLAIACLGLFALVSYSVESRTKEIGIRKVLGASVSGIVGLITKEFLLLVVIACVIAMPVAYYFMKQWLQSFAYKVDPGVEVFALAGAAVLFVAIITVSIRSVRSAMANPVNSLRND
jgi:putative ABC transport system permease protein